jgi:hypothetical protein
MHDEKQKHRHLVAVQDEKGNQSASNFIGMNESKSNVRHLEYIRYRVSTIRVADPESDYFRTLNPGPHWMSRSSKWGAGGL